MTDSIVRLKVDSQEYDQKLRRAAEGLQRYADGCRQVGGTLSVVEDETLAFVRAVGQMDTVSRSATGKLSEMKRTFTELASQYKQLTDEEKQSPFGKALAQSLDQLKTRINDSKGQLDDINKELNGSGGLSGALDAVAGKFGLNIGELTKFGGAMAAATTALKVAKDAFFASESSVDEWGRTVAASESVYEGFLNAINNGDISGYLSRIDQIVDAARKAYDELDKLGTMRTIQSPKMSEQEAENVRLRTMIMTGRFIAAPGRVSPLGLKTGDKLTADQIHTLEKQLQNGMQKIVGLVGKEVAQTGRAIDAYYNKLAQQNGLTKQEFMLGTSSWENFNARVTGANKYMEIENRRRAAASWAKAGHSLSTQQQADLNAANPYTQYRGWSTFRVDKMGENSYNDLVNLIKQQQQQQSQMYSMLGQSYRTINRVEGYNPRSVLGGGGGGGSTGGSARTAATITLGSVADYTNQIKNLRAEQLQVTSPEAWMGLQQQIDHLNVLIKELKSELKVEPYNFGSDASKRADNYWSELEKKFSNPDKIISDPLSKMVKEINRGHSKSSEFPQELSKITGGVSSIMGGIQQLGLDVPDGIQKMIALMQGMNTILTGIMALTSIIEVNSTTQAAASVIDAIKPFHFGGVVHAANGFAGKVPGTTYSGDNIPALLDAGEVVLTRAMAGNVASQLEGNNMGNLQLEAVVYAEQLRFMLRNNSKRRGKGEYITSKMKY